MGLLAGPYTRRGPDSRAGMAELADAPDSKSGARKGVGVRLPLPALGLTCTNALFMELQRLTRPRKEAGMAESGRKGGAPGFVVLRRVNQNRWELLGEVTRRRGLPARVARTQAVLDATEGKAKPGEVYAAVLRSEWRVALDWSTPTER